MPRQTDYDWYYEQPPSEVARYVLTPARPASSGISPPSPAQAEPSGLDAWIREEQLAADALVRMAMATPVTVTVKQVEPKPVVVDTMKDWHNPRKTNTPLVPPAACFADELPGPGQIIWVGNRGMISGSEYAFIRNYCLPATVLLNTENTVWLELSNGLVGHLCPCAPCKDMYIAGPAVSEAQRRRLREEMESYLGQQCAYQRRYIGHIGKWSKERSLSLLNYAVFKKNDETEDFTEEMEKALDRCTQSRMRDEAQNARISARFQGMFSVAETDE